MNYDIICLIFNLQNDVYEQPYVLCNEIYNRRLPQIQAKCNTCSMCTHVKSSVGTVELLLTSII